MFDFFLFCYWCWVDCGEFVFCWFDGLYGCVCFVDCLWDDEYGVGGVFNYFFCYVVEYGVGEVVVCMVFYDDEFGVWVSGLFGDGGGCVVDFGGCGVVDFGCVYGCGFVG